ncbi:MAG TPA: phytanoyl-CoA dioxygenase family protein, partial [Acidimicrobiales bacterium]|nr:phytanoyl-CoA dioxygenase family protein [Acidimicrobiales bacterium]
MIESYAIERGPAGWLPFHGGAVERLGRGGYKAAEDISAAYFVRASRMYSMRVKALVYLDPIEEEEDGPLLYVEGSHKANFPFMQSFSIDPRTLQGYDHLVRRITVDAGDLVLLNEAVVHGTRVKTSPVRRRVAIFTFGPSFVLEWADLGRDNTDLQRSGYGLVDTEDGHY